MKNRKATSASSQPIIRLRFMIIGLILLILVISGPLLVVTKQVYITDVSIRMNKQSDTLKALTREILDLRLTCEQLSSNARIEEFARFSRNLEYPTAHQIVIVKMREDGNGIDAGGVDKVLGFIKRSLGVYN